LVQLYISERAANMARGRFEGALWCRILTIIVTHKVVDFSV